MEGKDSSSEKSPSPADASVTLSTTSEEVLPSPPQPEAVQAGATAEPQGEDEEHDPAALRAKVEGLLSKENLIRSPALLAAMNAELWMPVAMLHSLGLVQAEAPAIVAAARDSERVSFNPEGTLVRPNMKAPRTSLILRDIPAATDSEEIKLLFKAKEGEAALPEPVAVNPDIGDCWFVAFATEEETLKALDHVRKQRFQEKPVKARIKTENLLRSLMNEAAASADPGSSDSVAGGLLPATDVTPPLAYYYDYTTGTTMAVPYAGFTYPYANSIPQQQQQQASRGGHVPLPIPAGIAPYNHAYGATGGDNRDRRRSKDPNRRRDGGGNRSANDSRDNVDGRRRKGGRGRRPQDSPEEQTPISRTPPQLGLQNFPPLGLVSEKTTHGYQKDFIKRTREEILEVVKDLEVPKQCPLRPTHQSAVVILDEANAKILAKPRINTTNNKNNSNDVEAQQRSGVSTTTATTGEDQKQTATTTITKSNNDEQASSSSSSPSSTVAATKPYNNAAAASSSLEASSKKTPSPPSSPSSTAEPSPASSSSSPAPAANNKSSYAQALSKKE